MPKKLIVLSVDSLFDEDIPLLKTLPNFGKLFEKMCIRDSRYCKQHKDRRD